MGEMKYAAFFRNLNLGRPHCPTRVQFEQAFVIAGATSASSFHTNGTLVFTVGKRSGPRRVLARACTELASCCGLQEPAFVRSVEYLAELVAQNPFATVAPASVYQCCASFLNDEGRPLAQLASQSARGDVKVLHCTGSEVLSLSLKIGKTPGSPNAFLEKSLGIAATTRNWNTIVRLVQRYA